MQGFEHKFLPISNHSIFLRDFKIFYAEYFTKSEGSEEMKVEGRSERKND